MIHRASFPPLLILLFVFFAVISSQTEAQQRQDQTRTFSIQTGGDLDRLHHVDEIGLRLSMSWLYHSALDIETYRLNAGDLLAIALEGNVTGTIRGLRVTSQGSLIIPEIGVIDVANQLFRNTEERVREKLLDFFPDTHVTLVLEQPRTIQIHVVGNIPFAGPQLVFAQTRLDQAIYRSFFRIRIADEERTEGERPDPEEVTEIDKVMTSIGMLDNKYPEDFLEANRYTLRNILINRTDGTIESADLIRYLKTGDLASNPVVQQGDIITINRFYEYNPRVSVSGAVHKPLELEYREDDSIATLIQMAGGTTYDAADGYIRIMRSGSDGVQELKLTDPNAIEDYVLRPNDRVIVPFEREKRASQTVQVFGEAQYTGRFPIQEGVTTLYDLLDMAGGYTNRALVNGAYLIRSRPAKTEYGFRGEVEQTEIQPHLSIPGSMYGVRPSFNPFMLWRTSDQYLQGFEYLELEAKLIRDRVHIDLGDADQMKSVKLFDGDRLQIPRNDGTVFVFGQVNQPGFYAYNAGWSAADYISNAGNFALSADPDRIFIVKSGTSSWYRPGQTTLEPGDLVFVDRMPFDEFQPAREYELRKRELRNSRIQLVVAGVATVANVIIAYVAVTR